MFKPNKKNKERAIISSDFPPLYRTSDKIVNIMTLILHMIDLKLKKIQCNNCELESSEILGNKSIKCKNFFFSQKCAKFVI